MGIYQRIEKQGDDLTVEKIAHRVLKNKQDYITKFEKKAKSEAKYYENKPKGLQE